MSKKRNTYYMPWLTITFVTFILTVVALMHGSVVFTAASFIVCLISFVVFLCKLFNGDPGNDSGFLPTDYRGC